MAFEQYVKCASPLDAVDGALGCLLLQWTTTDGVHDESEVGKSVKQKDRTVAVEWLGALTSQRTLSIVHRVQRTTAMHASTTTRTSPRQLWQSCRGPVIGFTVIASSENLG